MLKCCDIRSNMLIYDIRNNIAKVTCHICSMVRIITIPNHIPEDQHMKYAENKILC
jgi:hypothetical protein